MNVLEDTIDLLVPALPNLPPFDDALVISKNFEGCSHWVSRDKCFDKKLETDSFCPPNVPAL